MLQVELTDASLLALIENYCREAGVRNLQKQIEKIYRKVRHQLTFSTSCLHHITYFALISTLNCFQIALQLVRLGAANESSLASDAKADCLVNSSGNMIQEESEIKDETEEKRHEEKCDETSSDDTDSEQKHPQRSNDKLDGSKVLCDLCYLDYLSWHV